MKDRTKEWLFYNMGFLGAAVAAIAYGAWGLITIEETGKTVLQILGDVGVSLAVGFLIVTLLKLQGLIKGRSNADFIQVMADFIKALTNAVPQFKWLFRFVSKKNKEAYIIVRTTLLSKRGLKYEDYFDKDDRFYGKFEVIDKDDTKDLKRLKKAKNVAINKCLNLNITTLSPNDITADNGKPLDPLSMGETQEEWLTRTSTIGFMVTALMALLFGYFAPVYNDGWDYGLLIWKALQLVSFSISGLVQMYFAWLFITGVYKNRFIKKTNHLDELHVLGQEWDKEVVKIDDKGGAEDANV